MTTRVRVTNEAEPTHTEARTVRVVVMGPDDDTDMETRDLLPGRAETFFLHSGNRLSVYELPPDAGTDHAARP